MEAVQVNNSTLSSPPVSYCNVSIVYTHSGQNDRINVWLGLPDQWNNRFQGVGGGGWSAGLDPNTFTAAVAQGYASVTTDAGHIGSLNNSNTKPTWGLTSPGNVNMYLLQDFAATAVYDMTVLGKQITEAFYGKPISCSYWKG